MLRRPARLTAMLAISLVGMASTIAACSGSTPPPTPARTVVTPSTGASATTPPPSTSVATPPAGAANPAATAAPAAAGARKPTGTLIVQQQSLRNVPMIPLLGGSGLNVYQGLLYEWLTRLARDESTGRYYSTPGLATRWESTPDFKNWTFYLRQGIQWQDGYGEFTAADVKFTVDTLIKTPKALTTDTTMQTLRRIVDSVEVVDPYKVVFHLTTPFGMLDSMLSDLWTAAPISKKYVEKVGIEEANKKPVGSGPYKFVQLKVGESLQLEALDQHWRQVPYYKTIIFKEVAEHSTAIAMLKTGDTDMISAPISLKDEIIAAGFDERLNQGTEYTYVLYSGLWDEKLFPKETDLKVPWRDIRVREALDISLDRNEIIRSLYKSQAQASPVILFMPGTTGYNPDLKPYPYEPARAKKLLAEAGYPDGFEFNLPVYPWTHAPEVPDLGQVLALYWKKVGLRAKISWSEYTTVSSIMKEKKDPRMLLVRGSTRMAAPEAHLDTFFNPKGRTGIAAPDIWDLSQKMESEGDLAKKDALGRQVAQLIYDGHYAIPVAWSSMPYYVNPKKVGEWSFLKGEPYMTRLEYLKHPGDQ